MSTLEALLAAIVHDPLEETLWLVLADWLEEYDDPRRGELLRLHRKLLATCCATERHPERKAWHSRAVRLIRAGTRPCVPEETIALAEGVEIRFSFIPPGTFQMGSNKGDEREKPVRSIDLTRGFFLGKYPVTQAQWKAVMESDPSHFKGIDRPVECVSWNDAVEFCTKLSARLSDRGQIRLPTEAEWEYACRAGSTTDYYTGNGDASLEATGWYGGNSGKTTHPVGKLQPNQWGLYDMHGNVWEWCQDWYGDYSTSETTDPTGAGSGSLRVYRGGGWSGSAGYCRSAFRDGSGPTGRDYDLGFRAALVLES